MKNLKRNDSLEFDDLSALLPSVDGIENAKIILANAGAAEYYRIGDAKYFRSGITGKIYERDEDGGFTIVVTGYTTANIESIEGVISLAKLAWAYSWEVTKPAFEECYIQDTRTGDFLESYSVNTERYAARYNIHWTLDFAKARMVPAKVALDILKTEHNSEYLSLRYPTAQPQK